MHFRSSVVCLSICAACVCFEFDVYYVSTSFWMSHFHLTDQFRLLPLHMKPSEINKQCIFQRHHPPILINGHLRLFNLLLLINLLLLLFFLRSFLIRICLIIIFFHNILFFIVFLVFLSSPIFSFFSPYSSFSSPHYFPSSSFHLRCLLTHPPPSPHLHLLYPSHSIDTPRLP